MVVANQLFDALTAANVPRDQAHAVVDAIEHRMTAELATKADVAREVGLLRTETRAEFAAVRAEMAAEFAAVRAEMVAEFAAVRAETKADFAREIAGVKVDIAKLDTKMEVLHRTMLIQLGGLMVACSSALFAALKYLGG